MPGSPALLTLAAAAFCLLTACSGGNGPSPPDTGGGGAPGGNEIFGGERLGWNQAASSVSDLQAHSYTLYVDGVRAGMSDVRCSDVRATSGYECSAVLPTMTVGTRVLRLTATSRNVESEASSPLTVTVGRRVDTSATAPALSGDASELAPDIGDNRSFFSRACFDSAPAGCYVIERVARGLGHVTAFATLPDGRVLFVEDRRRVRVLPGASPLEDPAFAVGRTEQITGLAAHPGYSRNQTVYTSTIRVEGERHAVSVQRHRHVQDTFGETGTIIADLPAASPDVPFAVSAAGDLYLAFPVAGGVPAGPYDGRVLRFAEDGSVSREVRPTSPVFSFGHARPTALVADSATPALWMVGSGGAILEQLARVDLGGPRWPRVPSAVRVAGAGPGTARPRIVAMAPSPGSEEGPTTTMLYVTEETATMHWAAFRSPDFTAPIATARLQYAGERLGSTALVELPNGVVYIGVRSTDHPAGGGEILRLRPRR